MFESTVLEATGAILRIRVTNPVMINKVKVLYIILAYFPAISYQFVV